MGSLNPQGRNPRVRHVGSGESRTRSKRRNHLGGGVMSRSRDEYVRPAPTELDDGVSSLNRQLDELSNLPADYDGYGATPPSLECIARAREVLRSLHDFGMIPASARADAEGGAGFWFDAPARDRGVPHYRSARIVCRNDGRDFAVMYPSIPTDDVGFVRFATSDTHATNKAINAVHEFLNSDS